MRWGRHFGGTGRGGRAAASARAPVDAANACLPCRFRPRAPLLVAMVSTTPLGAPRGGRRQGGLCEGFQGLQRGCPGWAPQPDASQRLIAFLCVAASQN